MHTPSAPKLQPQAIQSARPREVDLEAVKEDERKKMKKRQGYSSTVMTRGSKLGIANTQKVRVTGE